MPTKTPTGNEGADGGFDESLIAKLANEFYRQLPNAPIPSQSTVPGGTPSGAALIPSPETALYPPKPAPTAQT